MAHSAYFDVIVIVLLIVFTLVSFQKRRDNESKEPRILRSRIPIIGHLVGIFTKHTQYFNELHAKHGRDIATLPMPGGKIYAIWDIDLAQSGLNAKAMSFNAIMIQHARGLLGLNHRSVDIARDSMLEDLMHITKPLLAGQSLVDISADVLNHAADIFADMAARETLDVSDLYSWVQKTATVAITQALYGEADPIQRDAALVDDIWIFETGLRKLAANVFPSITARSSIQARDRIVAAITPLFDESTNPKHRLPNLTLQRVETIRKNGISDPEQIARVELALLHGATVNTVPTLFWTLVQVFARPELLRAIRHEASSQLAPGSQLILPIRSLDDSFPLLMSTYQESTRLANSAMSTRLAMSETIVADGKGREYTIPTGSTVLMPASLHVSPDIWGPEAANFQPRRFLNWNNRGDPIVKKRRAAYVPFGGGKHLCPGRNLAKYEILGIVLALCMTFDMEDAGHAGRPVLVPALEPARMGQGVGKPAVQENGGKIPVKFVRRAGWDNPRWEFRA